MLQNLLSAAVMNSAFANNLDPDQDPQNVGPDSGSKLFDTLIGYLKLFLKVNFEKSQQTTHKNLSNKMYSFTLIMPEEPVPIDLISFTMNLQ